MSIRRTVCGLAAVLAFAPAAAHADATTVIGFDGLTAGDVVQDQYAPAIRFASPADYGFAITVDPGNGQAPQGACAPVSTRPNEWSSAVIAAPDTSSAPNALLLANCGDEVQSQLGTFFVLPTWRSTVSVRVGSSGAPASTTFELAAWDSNRHLLGTATATSEGGVTTPLAFTSPLGTNVVAFVAVWVSAGARGGGPAIDDVSFNDPATPPPPQVTLAGHTDELRVRQGADAQLALTLVRWNGSSGRVQLAAPAVPAGISSQSFQPSITAGTTTTWTLHAALDAAAASQRVDVTADPVDPGAGSDSSTLTVPVSIVPNYSIAPRSELDVPPCTPVTLDTGLHVEPGFDGHVRIDRSQPGGIVVSPDSIDYSPGFGGSTSFTLKGTAALPGNSSITITASSPPYAAQQRTVALTRIPGHIDAVYDAPETVGGRHLSPGSSLDLPVWGHDGTRLLITGEGFCPGSTVSFGNPDASATPYAVADDGSWLEVEVPHLAVPGQIAVSTPYGTLHPSPDTAYTVDGLVRQQASFSFPNSAGPTLGFDDLEEAFGFDQTHLSVDPCSWLTLGLGSCDLGTTWIPSPAALAFAAYYHDAPTKGLCFGMAVLSDQWLTGGFDPRSVDPNASALSELLPTGNVRHAIMLRHILQYSFESRLAMKLRMESEGNAPALRGDVLAEVGQHRPVMIIMRSGGAGHAVLAYGLRDSGGGAFDIDVYNPNTPWDPTEVSTDPSSHTHRDNEASSVVHVNADGSWSFPELGWSGSGPSIFSLPFSAILAHPTLPDRSGDWVVLDIAGSRLDQLRDGRGHALIDQHGNGQLGATVLPATDPGVQPSVLLPRGGTYSLQLGHAGPTSLLVATRGFVASVDGTLPAGGPGAANAVGFTARLGQLSVPEAATPVHATLSETGSDGSVHTASLAASGSGLDSLQVDPSGGGVTVDHSGGAGAVQLGLGWAGHGSLPASLDAQPLRLVDGDRLSVDPVGARTLARPVQATIHHRDGTATRVTLVPRHASGGRIASLRLATAHHGSTLSVTARTTTSGAVSGQATLALALARGGRVVRTHVVTVDARTLASGRFTWRVSGLRHGRYRLVGGAVVVAGGPLEHAISRRTSRVLAL